MTESEISRIITEAAMQIHRAGSTRGSYLEARAFRDQLGYELESRGLRTSRRLIPPGEYGGVRTKKPEPIEMIINDLVIVECRYALNPEPVWEAEALAHLRMTGLKLAVIINFGESKIRDGIRRVQNILPDAP